jgi:ribosomal protein S12 methylthiotransferase accessory factor
VVSQLASLRELVSERTGIIRSLTLRPPSADASPVPILYEGVLSNFDFRRGTGAERSSCGKGLTEEDAMLGAIGEAIERYCAGHPATDLRRAKFEALDTEALPPEAWVLYSQGQYAREGFPFRPYQRTDEIPWTTMRELSSGRAVLAPASLVYLSGVSDQPEDALTMPTSSGCAAGPDAKTALRSALLELIERDAFMISWLARLPPQEIELEGVNGAAREICTTYGRWGTAIRAFALPTDLPATVVMAVALGRSPELPAAIVGLGCALSPSEALVRALFEIGQMHGPLRRRHAEGAAQRLDRYEMVRTLDDHAAYFFRSDHLPELDFLLRASVTSRVCDLRDFGTSTVEGDLEVLARGFGALGLQALYRDLTTQDLLPYPIRVVRALVSHLQPISFGAGLERLGGRRVYQRGNVEESTLNPCPHPLA